MKSWILFFAVFLCALTSLPARQAVYFVHGFLRTSRSMNQMAEAFRKEGYLTEKWAYPSRQKHIRQHAAALVLDLQKTAFEHPGEPIHFVTHSMGGLVVRAALNLEACPPEAKFGRAVLMAPPNQGSRFGRSLNRYPVAKKILGDRAGRELLNEQNFEHLGQFPSEMEVLVISGTWSLNPFIWEKNDGKVTVSESYLSTPHSHIRVSAGHATIMDSRASILAAINFIKEFK